MLKIPKENSYNLCNNCFQGIAEFAEDNKNYLCAKELYLQAGCLYKAYQMEKNQRTLAEKIKRNKELSKEFIKRVLSN